MRGKEGQAVQWEVTEAGKRQRTKDQETETLCSCLERWEQRKSSGRKSGSQYAAVCCPRSGCPVDLLSNLMDFCVGVISK